MNSTTVAVDLAKNVFELAAADGQWRIVERYRLNRARFSRFFVHRPPCQIVMEAADPGGGSQRAAFACARCEAICRAQQDRSG